ncbi:hypothetical protein SAMN05216489_00593 [Streptomyces sp. 3213]|uniref:hypothetical protein n=1 Tax=Streptomyces sp. 3213.3 TaxID=1855348 RepID=UPI000898506D|nr:hypothetical protein [Streptomyces sp. 3213.3]SEC38363.1 hypothetical protein SAMN05216489_00593 [Streptomyces sp. 3213] [Streptomyces sp. 3213.3]
MTQTPPPTIAYELFDCLQVNLAVLADRWHGAGTHLRLGATLHFGPETGVNGLPTVARTVEQHLADAQSNLGIAVRALHRTPATTGLPLADGCYVVSDAYHLPWVPYFQQRHMEHSFLAEAGGTDDVNVVDAYHNETPWGNARPGVWTLPAQDFIAAVPSPVLVAELAPAAERPGAAAATLDLAGPEAVDAYVDAYAQYPDRNTALSQLTLETWFLARSRKLHAAFRAQFGPSPDSAVDAHLRAWGTLTEQTYLAARRVERGRTEPPALLPRLREQLHADSVVFGLDPIAGDVAESPSAAGTELRGTVAAVAAAVLGTEVERLLKGQLLSDVPRFSSFRIVEIVERLEEELRFEFAADDLVPENLHDIDALCAIVRRSLCAEPALAHLEEA